MNLSVVPLYALVSCNDEVLSEATDPATTFDYVDISAVSQGVIFDELERTSFASAPSRARRLAKPGDVILSTVRTYLRAVATVDEYDEPRVYSTGFAVLRPLKHADGRYLFYRFQSDDFMEDVIVRSVGVNYPAITARDLMHVRVSVPPLARQSLIADFLDRETAQIDALIEKQYALIDRLRERRRALHEHVTTRGLGTLELRPEPGSWIGMVPSHWEVGNIRRYASMHSGHTPSRSKPEYWEDCHIPWFTLADVWQLRSGETYLGETKTLISDLGLANSAAELLPAGTVVLSRTASVGFPGIMPCPMATSQDFWNWVCGPNLVPEYLVYVFRAMHREFAALRHGSTHQTIYQGAAAGFRIPVPPVAEQREIVEYLDRETAKVDDLIAKAKRFIELARERRSALITAAVTGQIDVTGAGAA